MSGVYDFGAGDLVVCIYDGPDRWGHVPIQSRRGDVVRVSVLLAPDETSDGGWAFIAVGDPVGHLCRAAERFRKIESADDAFIRQLAFCKPKELQSL